MVWHDLVWYDSIMVWYYLVWYEIAIPWYHHTTCGINKAQCSIMVFGSDHKQELP
jgi:hypothetical protein